MNVTLEISITFDEFGWALLDEEARAEGLGARSAGGAGVQLLRVGARRRADGDAWFLGFDQPAAERETRTLVLELDARVPGAAGAGGRAPGTWARASV